MRYKDHTENNVIKDKFISKPLRLRVKELCKAQNITIKLLSRSANLAYDTAFDYYHSRMLRIDWDTMQKIAYVLDVHPKDLIAD